MWRNNLKDWAICKLSLRRDWAKRSKLFKEIYLQVTGAKSWKKMLKNN